MIRARARAGIPTTRSCCWLRGGAATPYDRRKWEQQQTLGPLRLRERRRTAPTSGWNGRRQRRRPARRCTADMCVPTRVAPAPDRFHGNSSRARSSAPHGRMVLWTLQAARKSWGRAGLARAPARVRTCHDASVPTARPLPRRTRTASAASWCRRAPVRACPRLGRVWAGR